MLIKTRGIVFRTIKYSETSFISEIYTEEKGLQKYIIGGVRAKKSRVSPGLFQVMSLVDLVAYYRDDDRLQRIKEIKSAYPYQSIPFQVRRGAVGQFMVEVARKAIREPESNAELFQFLFETFRYLDKTDQSYFNIHLSYLVLLSRYLGFIPQSSPGMNYAFFDLQEGVFCQQCPAHPNFIEGLLCEKFKELLLVSIEQSHAWQIDRQQRNQILSYLLDYYRLHIEHFSEIHSHRILQDVLGG